MNIYVGNLPFTMTDADLSSLFSRFGEVSNARIVQDKFSGRSKGFGFVEMSDDSAKAAISELDGTEHNGRPLKVNEAKPREERPQGSRPPRRDYGGNRDGGNRDYGNRGDRGDRRRRD